MFSVSLILRRLRMLRLTQMTVAVMKKNVEKKMMMTMNTAYS